MRLPRYTEFIKESNEGIDSICKRYNIKNYTINSDGTINVNGDVNLNNNRLIKLPLKFNEVYGYFNCGNNKLISLEGCPKLVRGSFDCYKNELSSLNEGPEYVGLDFNLACNKLNSLEGCPISVGRYFNLNSNEIRSFKGFTEFHEGLVHIELNPVSEITHLFKFEQIDKAIYWINEFDVIRDEKQVVLDRLEEVFIQMDLKVPQNLKLKNYEII